MLRDTVARAPTTVATIFHNRRTTYACVLQEAEAFAAALQERGVRPGDRVAIMLPNVPQFLVAFYGTLIAGAIVVPTNPLYTRHELEHQLHDAGAIAIVTLDLFFPVVQAALTETEIHTVIVGSVAEALPSFLGPLYAAKSRYEGVRPVPTGGVVIHFADAVGCRRPPPPDVRRPEDVAVLQYTGGTTGTAKGAMLTHRNLVANALQTRAWQGSSPGDGSGVLCAAPFFHVYGLTVGMNLSIASRGTMVLVPRFIPSEVAKVAQRYRPSLFPGVPTMYLALAALNDFSAKQFGSLEVCISGAAALPEEVRRRFGEVTGTQLVEGYGLTEASPVTHCNPVHGESRPGTIGVPFPDTDACITDPLTWETLPHGDTGEITVRGPQVMAGYWNSEDETARVLRNGWLHTGDLGTVDADGYFTVVDRIKDVIIASGYNVYPREVEEVLYAHPKVREAAVIGIESEYRGQTVKAVVVPRDGATITPAEIMAYCKGKLAPFKVPKVVEIRGDLPKSLIGKVLRRELREEAERDVVAPAALTGEMV
jgi:long-chain acyl-CoA synthetase